MRRLVVGVGNVLLGDEGLGVHVARELASRPEVVARTDIIDAGTSLFDFAGEVAGHDELVIVDAVRAGGEPGTVYRIDDLGRLLDEAPGSPPMSLHEWSAIDMLRSLRLVGITLPRVVLLGAEPARIAPGTDLSPAVRDAAARIVAMIVAHQPCDPAPVTRH